MQTQRQKVDAILNQINSLNPDNMNFVKWIKYYYLKIKFKRAHKKLMKECNLSK